MKHFFQKTAPMGLVFIFALIVVIEAGLLIGGYLYYVNLETMSEELPVTNNVRGRRVNAGAELPPAKQPNRGNCLADECLSVEGFEFPAGELPPEVKTALDEALSDEYKALTTYEAVIAKFGAVRPFSMIKGAEEQHIASLKALYDKYGLTAPKNTWTGKVTAPATLNDACSIGVAAETENAKLYQNKLLPAVTAYADITLVFTNLMNASKQKHLPAFDGCQ